jgi:hypothetical protein
MKFKFHVVLPPDFSHPQGKYFHNKIPQICMWHPWYGSHTSSNLTKLGITLLKITAIKQSLIQICSIFLSYQRSKKSFLPAVRGMLDFM